MCVVITNNEGSARKGKPHEIRCTHSHTNIHVRLVDCLAAILDFFEVSNTIDKHKHNCAILPIHKIKFPAWTPTQKVIAMSKLL